jgi:hypothetical protein
MEIEDSIRFYWEARKLIHEAKGDDRAKLVEQLDTYHEQITRVLNAKEEGRAVTALTEVRLSALQRNIIWQINTILNKKQ